MKRLMQVMMSAGALLVSAMGVHGQDLLVPAGTLLQCTMEEPNFSSATASVGDPVLCHLKGFQEFGRTVFPRGSMLAGHLEADKDPGHFVGKGYLKITFDRVIVPNGDMPMPAKVISAKGYKVDKEGDIKGKGHATRDTVEWLIPPLWPWKVLTLPARGPRPTIKGEEPMQLRLMDDIVVPQAVAHGYLGSGNRPPYASSDRPNAYAAPQSIVVPPAAMPTALRQGAAPVGNGGVIQAAANTPPMPNGVASTRYNIVVLKSNQMVEVAKYRVDNGMLAYQMLDGTLGSVDVQQVDWRKTTELSGQVRSVDVPAMVSQTN
jgi:hypothetical protein